MAKNNEAKIKFTAETGEFNESIKKADKTLGNLRAELNLNETQMKATGATVEGLEQKHNILERQLAASQSKTEALSSKIEVAARLFGENSNEVLGLQEKLLRAQAAEERIKQALSKCNKELEAQEAAAKEADSATKKLTDTIDDQQKEVDKLKDEYKEAVLQYGETSDEAKDLAKKLSSLSEELADNKRKLDDAADAADKLDKSLDDAGDSARDAEDGFTVMKGAISDLVSNAIQWGIGKMSEFIDYLKELPEATREFRQDMATLNTSFESAGLSTEQATDTWKELYTIFGEDDRAVEAANLIAKMSDNQAELNEWVTITKGIWGSYQDSLPVEGLAEASNETAKTGKVTGVLADALNWSGEAASMFSKYMSEDVTTAEDAFNEALKKCTTEEERQALITETLTKLYGDAAQKYEEAAGAQLEEKEAAAEAALAQAELAAAIAPATTAWTNLKTQLVTAVAPAIEKVCGWLSTAFEWLQEHPAAMTAVAAAVSALGAALTVLAVAMAIATVKQWLMNAAVLANPITWIVVAIVAAVAALIAIGVALYQNWDKIKAKCSELWNGIKAVFSGIGEWVNNNVIQPVVRFFKGLWDSIKNIWDGIVNVVKVAFLFIGSIISAAWNIITLPFRFIWENCKQYVFAAFEWIKAKIASAVQWIKNIFGTIKNFFSGVWNGVKNVFAPVANWFRDKFNSAKQGVQNAWSSVKGFFSNIWNGTKNVFANVGGWFRNKFSSAKQGVQNAWSSVTGFFSGIYSKIKAKFAQVKDAIIKPFKTAIDKVKSFFNGLKLKFPKIKMPHFKIKGKFSLSPPSVPKLSIDWYAKGAIFTRPTIFPTASGFKGVGDVRGGEAVLPIDRLRGYVTEAVQRTMPQQDLTPLVDAIEELASRPINFDLNGRRFAQATAGDTDSVNGVRNSLLDRGLVLD